MLKIGHNYERSPTLAFRSGIHFKEGDNILTFDATKKLMKNMLALKFKLSMSKRGVVPSISFNSS